MKILMVDGSGRDGSLNRQFLEAFGQLILAQAPGARLTYVSPVSHPVPNLIPGLEHSGMATAACDEVRRLALLTDAFVIASPEYNGGPTGSLKNLLDWMSSPNAAQPKGNPFVMKPTVLLSASSGSLGGIKGLQVLRLILGHLRALILPEQVALSLAHEAFEATGTLKPGLAADLSLTAAQQLVDYLER